MTTIRTHSDDHPGLVIKIDNPGHYRVAAYPLEHRGRGTVEKGGRFRPSAEWLPGEYIDLVDSTGKVIAHLVGINPGERMLPGGGQTDFGGSAVVTLAVGEYRFVASPGFVGQFGADAVNH